MDELATAAVPPPASQPLAPNAVSPGAIPVAQLNPAQLSAPVPAGAIPVANLDASKLSVPNLPPGAVPVSQLNPAALQTQGDFLNTATRDQIVSASLDASDLTPYKEAFRKKSASLNFLDHAPDVPTGITDEEAKREAVKAIVPGAGAYFMGEDMAEGILTQLNEAARGALGMDPMAARLQTAAEAKASPNVAAVLPDLTEQQREQSVSNVTSGLKVKAVQGLSMLDTFANRLYNRLTVNKNAETGAPEPTQLDNESFDSQFETARAFKMAEQGLSEGASYGVQRPTDPAVMQKLAQSPLDASLLILGGAGLEAATAGEGMAVRVLSSTSGDVGRLAGDNAIISKFLNSGNAGQQAVKAASDLLSKPVQMASNATAAVANIAEASPLLKATTAALGTAAFGGSGFDSAVAALLGANAKLGSLESISDSLGNTAAQLAGKVPPGPMGRFALSVGKVVGDELPPVVAGQLANIPFALGAGDDKSFKDMVTGGLLMHAAGRSAGAVLNGLDVGRNLWAENPTLPDTRLPVKPYGTDDVLDAAHQKVADGLSNSSNNFVQLVRDYFGKNKGEIYTLYPSDYNKALDSYVANGQLDASTAAQAKNQAGVTLPIQQEDGSVVQTALSKVSGQTPGISVGHEAGHLLENLLSAEELTHVYSQIADTYGPSQMAAYKQKYEALANASGGAVSLTPTQVASEIFAEHASAVLNSIPIEKFSDPDMDTKDFSRSMYSMVARGLEKIGVKTPQLVDFSGEAAAPQTGLGIQPSAKIGNIIENVLQAHALDSAALKYDTPSGKPPITPEQATLGKKTPAMSGKQAPIVGGDGFPAHPVTENTPQGVQTGGAGAENTVAPKQEENVVRPEGPANVRVTPVQQNQFGEATPETLKANTEHFTKAFAGPRSAINPVEMSYLSAKEPSGKAGNQVKREQQRVAADRLEQAAKRQGLPNPLREKYQKVSVPYGWAGDESRIHAMSLDKVVHNVDLLQGFLHLNPEAAKVVDPQYLASPQLTRDLQTYLSNQSHGYSGAGEELVRPADTRENTVTPQDDNYTPVKLDPKKAQIINMLMGMEQPEKMTPGQAYSTRFAQQNGIETVPVKTAKGNIVQDTNPVRAELRTGHGFDPKVLNAAVEVLNTKRITAPVKERPDLNFKAGDTAFQRAGFMPEVKRPQGNDETRRVAAEYVKDSGIGGSPHTGNAPVNEELAKRIADFYHEAKSEPNAPAVKNAYQALADETMSQYGAMKAVGIKIEPWDGKGEPYKNSAEMQADVRDNKHLWFFKTDNGFGDGAPQENALLQPSGVKINGHELLANDVFRAVHDYFGHTAEGYEFGPRGEYNAYLTHSKMFSDEAKPALAAETLAQNSWVNFGPHLRREDGSLPQRGDADFVPLPKRPFAEQKNVAVPRGLIDEAEKNGASFMPQLRGPKLEHAVPEDELSLVHYGDQGLKSIDTSHFGKSGITPRSELSGAPRSYWYEEGQENKHDPVLGRGAKYAATVAGNRIYDGDADPLGYGSIINREKADDMLKDAGYAGIRRTGGRGRNSYSQVELFEPVKPTRLAPEKQAASFMPRMANLTDDQRSALEDAVRSFAGRKPTPDEADTVARKLRAIPTETPVEQRTVPGKELANATLPKGTGAFPLNDEADGHRTGNAAEIAWRGLVNTWGKRNASFMPEEDAREGRAYKNIAKYLTPDEREGMRADVAQRMVDAFKELPPDEEFQHAVAMGAAKKGWYERAAKSLHTVFGDDTGKFVSLLAATSPRQSVALNLEMALDVWQKYLEEGRPTDKDAVKKLVTPIVGLDSRINNSVRALSGQPMEEGEKNGELSGNKVEAFRQNLLGNMNVSTNDSWMAQFAGIPQVQFATTYGHKAFTAKIRRVADKMGIEPAHVQETVWSFFKTLVEGVKEGKTAKEVLASMNEKDILNTPEFHDELLNNPKVVAALKRLGHESKLEGLEDTEIAGRRANASDKPLASVAVPESKGGARILARFAHRAQTIKNAELAGASVAPVGSVVPEAPGENPF